MRGAVADGNADNFVRAHDVASALSVLAEGSCRILAGGTDVFPALQDRPLSGLVLDISGIKTLRRIEDLGDVWSIGAAASWRDVMDAPLPAAFDGVKAAAAAVGSWQIQNRATVVGNICNASPAADGVPPLLTLDAEVRLESQRGVRQMPLAAFVRGNRRTECADDEMVTAIIVPKTATAGQGYFYKLGARRYLVISIGMVAMRLLCDDNKQLSEIAIAVGACSEVAQRLDGLEHCLRGQALARAAGLVTADHFASLSPIDDVRAPASYRHYAVQEIVTRLLVAANKAANGEAYEEASDRAL